MKHSSFRIPHSAFRIIFLLILLAGGAMRWLDLEHCPAGFFRDEAEKGYNAWALATSGGALDFSDGTGPGPQVQWRRWPWMINVMGGQTSAIYQYASIPFMWAGGPRVGVTRQAAALTGTLTLALLGWLLIQAWGWGAGLSAMTWLALCPWHLIFSRWALEGIFVPFWIVLTLAGLWGWEKGRRWGMPLTGASLGWLFYSYSGAQPFVLAWTACLALIYRRRLKARWNSLLTPPHSLLLLALVLFLIPVVPTLIVRLEPGGSTRLARVAIWSTPGIGASGVAARFLLNYLAHFDPRFLFFAGDRLPRHGLPGQGQLLFIDLLLMPLGLILTFRQKRPLAGALLGIFLCGPLPAALTREGIPHALRAFAMVIPATAWSGLGLFSTACWIKARLGEKGASPRRASWLAGTFVTACLLIGLNGYFRYWRINHEDPRVWVAFEAGERQTWEQLARTRRPGRRVFVNGYIPYAPYFQLFFMRTPVRKVNLQGVGGDEFIYFNPEQISPQLVEAKMRPGDWLIEPADPARFLNPATGRPLLSPEESREIKEPWIFAIKK